MLTSRLPQIILMSESLVAAAVRKAEASIERIAKKLSRVETGAMRSGWQSRSMGVMEGIVYNLVSYTIYNEYGTIYMSAQPMLRPAVEQTRDQFETDIRAAYL